MQFNGLGRREFLSLLGGAATAWPLPAHAQRSSASRIGCLNAASPARFLDAAFSEGLREAGFIEGQNVTLEYRWAKGAYERLPALAAELVDLRIDLSTLPAMTPAWRRTSVMMLKGAKPAELPVQQPTKFELVVNLKAAKALGIELSPKLLALADEVIE